MKRGAMYWYWAIEAISLTGIGLALYWIWSFTHQLIFHLEKIERILSHGGTA